MKKIIWFILFSTAFFKTNAQPQGYQWRFGTNAALDFSTGAPVSVAGSQLATDEGCSSIADAAGNLLFYSDGITVWNKLNIVMPNGAGLNGGSSSTESALIVPLPGSANLYYIFTAGQSLGNFCYSIVDMNLQGGNGDVTTKNVLVKSTIREKLCAVKHANGIDYWIIIHDVAISNLQAYHFSAAGLNTTPVISSAGPNNADIGYLKGSPDGTRLIEAHWNSPNAFVLFDFNNATGVATNPYQLPAHTYSSGCYGAEFSPGGQFLYCTLITPAQIYQYDLSAGTQAAIAASEILIGTSATNFNGALQRAPDGKIYVAEYGVNHLGVINYPDSAGIACNFVDVGKVFTPGLSRLGLPNYPSDYFIGGFTFNKTCFGDSTHFNLNYTSALAAAVWDFDDVASGINNTSNLFSPSHLYTSAGIYNAKVIRYYLNGGIDSITKQVTIDALPFINLGADTTICNGSSLTLNAGPGNIIYLWQDGSTNSVYTVTNAGTYFVNATSGACESTDTIQVATTSCAVPLIIISSTDTSWCDKKCIDFFDLSTNNPTSWQWYFPGATPDTSTLQNPTGICYNANGTFDVQLIACNNAGCDTLFLPDFITEFQATTPPVITNSNDTLISTPALTYQWFLIPNPIPGATNQSYVPTQAGSYYVFITDSIGCEAVSNIIVITGIETFSSQLFYTVYNQQQNSLTLNFTEQLNDKKMTMAIYDEVGKVVSESSFDIKSKTKVISLPELESGIYFTVIYTGNKIYSSRFLISK